MKFNIFGLVKMMKTRPWKENSGGGKGVKGIECREIWRRRERVEKSGNLQKP